MVKLIYNIILYKFIYKFFIKKKNINLIIQIFSSSETIYL